MCVVQENNIYAKLEKVWKYVPIKMISYVFSVEYIKNKSFIQYWASQSTCISITLRLNLVCSLEHTESELLTDLILFPVKGRGLSIRFCIVLK